jgi:molybdate transport system substrate-binding protein
MKTKHKSVTVMLVVLSMLLTACKASDAPATDTAVPAAQTAEEASADNDAAGKMASEESSETATVKSKEAKELTILAAASLTDVCNELKEKYEKEHPEVTLNLSYGSSGALQTQIEEGAPCDIFFSAAKKQMDALNEASLMDAASISDLLENRVVLVVPAEGGADITSFEDVSSDKVKMIGLGEPESVPAGHYAEEVFTTLGTLDAVKAKANYGQDVRTVLTWVEEGDVDCGVVYATDAYTTDKVKIIAEAPEGSCKKVIYPVGIVAASENKDTAADFIAFLKTDDVLKVFEGYGFTPVK